MTERLLARPITVWRASRAIATVTVIVTVAGGVLVRLIDSSEFSSIGESLWWSLQTVTTVGYGDVVPHNDSGRFVGVVLMVAGVGFLAVVTGSIAAAFTQAALRREPGARGDPLASRIDELIARVERLEQAVREPSGSDDRSD
jgi:voltage-gated potassium channel